MNIVMHTIRKSFSLHEVASLIVVQWTIYPEQQHIWSQLQKNLLLILGKVFIYSFQITRMPWHK